MEYLQITSVNNFQAKKIYECYSSYFPENERRSLEQFNALFTNDKVSVFAVLRNCNFVGYVIGWKLSQCFFIEHFEIFSEFRSQKYGTEVLQDLYKMFSKIILESEPAELNLDCERRISFYEKNGFQIIDKNYMQPPYDQTKNEVQLWLLSNFPTEKKEWLKEEIYDVVYCQ